MQLPLVFVHSYIDRNGHGQYRIFPGILLTGDSTTRNAEILIQIPNTTQTILIREDHLTIRDSARYWVYANKRTQMIREVLTDWNQRQCWFEAMEDAKRWEAVSAEELQTIHETLLSNYNAHGLKDRNFDLLARRYAQVQERARHMLSEESNTAAKQFLEFLLG